MASPKLYLGLDSSTQSLKAVAVSAASEDALRITHNYVVNYDKDLPHFRTSGGMHEVGARVTSPVLMWLEALDMLLERMRSDSFPFENVLALSGSGQQHGSVYWLRGASVSLGQLDASITLAQQLKDAFARLDSPIWADSSTSAQCAALEQALGGADVLAAASGSRAYERFTGNQIARIVAEDNDAVYAKCERISLVSSFMCSIFLGAYAPIDSSDGSGTNLNDIQVDGGTRWNTRALAACSPSDDAEGIGLRERLGERLTEPHVSLGSVAAYFVTRYGFSKECRIVAWSGDNPCSLAGLGLQQAGDVAVSLGTSDTMFAMMARAAPGQDGHVMRNPVDPNSFMGMLCFKNGSLAREEVRDRCCGGDWESFANMLRERPAGNGGAIGFYFTSPEITPTTGDQRGVWRFDSSGDAVTSFDAATEVRAVIEGKFLAMRHFGQGIGMDPAEVRRIIATGGASANVGVLQVLADVFNVPVLTLEQADSAALGAAYRACHGHQCNTEGRFIQFSEVLAVKNLAGQGPLVYSEAARPSPAARAVYAQMLGNFSKLQDTVLDEMRAKKRQKVEAPH